jgi:hypothetical protein
MPQQQRDEPPVAERPASRLIPWLLGVCLVCFLVFLAVGLLEAFVGMPLLARSTPTPAFLDGAEVVLVMPDGGPVTVWQVGGACQVGKAFGQVPAGTGAHVQAGGCYSRDRRAFLYRIVLDNGSGGWVADEDLVPAAAYTPPTTTATPTPRRTATPRPTLPLPTAPPTAEPTRAATAEPLPAGSILYVDSWGLRVDRVETAGTLSSPAGDKWVEAAGRYALVYLSATNVGARDATLHVSRIYLEDAAGNRYGNDDTASSYASTAGCFDFALDVAPGDSVCLVAAIDVPLESASYLLSLEGARQAVRLDVP